MECETHKQQTYCVYCRDCEKLACPVCLSQNHKKHDLEEIRTIVEEKKLEIKRYEQRYRTSLLPEDDDNDFLLGKAVILNNEKYDETKKKIKDHEQFMKNEVARHINELLVDLDDRLKTNQLCISQEKKKLVERRSQMNEKIREIRECEKKTDIMEILKMAASAKRYFQKLTDEEIIIPLSSSVFVKGKSPESLKTIIGSIQEENIPKQNITKEIKLEVVKIYKTDVYEVFSVDPSNDGSFFSIL
ncbi:RING finger domain and kelch repeat-containing protein DDB_G0271372-like [Mytilus edulis]|uniref:RING finger domain and kelch repeat-containing protein DDB_G0271372-like n=1 Tax=Mytilus edulis TaxID=6550 RepID=UPI0039F14804